MIRKNCPVFENCPVFKKNIFVDERSQLTFKTAYCKAGYAKYTQCKRFQALEVSHEKIPENILPNSKLSVREILLIASSLKEE